MDWIIGILLLAVKDLQNGFLAVGDRLLLVEVFLKQMDH